MKIKNILISISIMPAMILCWLVIRLAVKIMGIGKNDGVHTY